jgi:phosphatidylglycerophosphate synthase
MISGRLGHFLDKPLQSIARKIRITPNFLTVAGFLITLSSASVIPFGPVVGGALMLFGGLFDVMDGIIARANGKASKSGAFLDSVLDRFSDAFLFLGVSMYFYFSGEPLSAVLSILALIGSFGVSYARARAEGLGYACTVGIMERPERILLLALGCLFPSLLVVAIWIILIGSYITVIQRMHYTWKAMNR